MFSPCTSALAGRLDDDDALPVAVTGMKPARLAVGGNGTGIGIGMGIGMLTLVVTSLGEEGTSTAAACDVVGDHMIGIGEGLREGLREGMNTLPSTTAACDVVENPVTGLGEGLC